MVGAAISLAVGWIFDPRHWLAWPFAFVALLIVVTHVVLIPMIKARHPATATTCQPLPQEQACSSSAPGAKQALTDEYTYAAKYLEAACTSPLTVGHRGHVLAMASDGKGELNGHMDKPHFARFTWQPVQASIRSLRFRKRNDQHEVVWIKIRVRSLDTDLVFPDGDTEERSVDLATSSDPARFAIEASRTGHHSVEVTFLAKKNVSASVYVSAEVESSAAADDYVEIGGFRVTFEVLPDLRMEQGIERYLDRKMEESLGVDRGAERDNGRGMEL